MSSLAARESAGGVSPGRYFPVRTPWASGDQTICEPLERRVDLLGDLRARQAAIIR
jgi:hypothetical protein